jgi:ABC-2 type transport system permease protein
MKDKINRIYAIVLSHLYTTKPSSIFKNVPMLVVDVATWGYFTSHLSSHASSKSYLAPSVLGGILLWNNVFLRSLKTVTSSFNQEMSSRNLLNLFITPLSAGELLLGNMIVSLVQILPNAIVVGFAAWLLFSFNIFQVGFWLLPLIINLILMGWTVGIVLIAFSMYYGRSSRALGSTLRKTLLPLSAVLYPISVLPNMIKPVTFVLPSMYTFQGLREAFANDYVSWRILYIPFLLNILYISVAYFFFEKMFWQGRKRGNLAKSAG